MFWLPIVGLFWFLSAWCTTNVRTLTIGSVGWAVALFLLTIGAGLLLDRWVSEPGSIPRVIARTFASALAVFVLAVPILAVLPPAKAGGCA